MALLIAILLLMPQDDGATTFGDHVPEGYESEDLIDRRNIETFCADPATLDICFQLTRRQI